MISQQSASFSRQQSSFSRQYSSVGSPGKEELPPLPLCDRNLGRDYWLLGESKSVKHRIGNGEGYPFKGPIRLKFAERQLLAVIEPQKGISFVKLKLNDDNFGSIAGSEAGALDDINEAESITFLSISAVDIVRVPLSSNFAICESTHNAIKFIDGNEWYQKKVLPGDFGTLAGVEVFKIGYEVQFIVCDSLRRTVYVVKEGGQILSSSQGDAQTVLADPSSVSLYCEEDNVTLKFRSPQWYLGAMTLDELMDELPPNSEPGSFVVAKDKAKPSVYNIVYLDSMWARGSATVVPMENGDVMIASGDSTLVAASLWDAVQNWDMLVKVTNYSLSLL
jgi:hypothetical protein